MTWTKYKCVVLMSIAAVAIGSAYTLANFNEIVAPDVPVQAIRFENAGADVYRLEIMGENLVVKRPDKYYRLIENKCGEILMSSNNNAAAFRDKFLSDIIPRVLQIEKGLEHWFQTLPFESVRKKG
ncbi:MAG: hypothetical protein A4E54_00665 [Pelotomaculum sp. PtaB.Bin117]|nr:MAG: hypothetical protein A4E54_00665 [Pelotomaculum sp. PtaB.Bin117]OPY60061.1 MAG: hypothetical protein A4E56_02923 [Pelotomaculum sp. PtaU1.Bin065]